jgi:hypothetical protein
MPKLSYPKDMSDLTGEVFSPDPIRDNIESIDDLVNGTGLDWENVSPWSLDHGHIYPQNVPPGDAKATKVATSGYSGGLQPASIITVNFPANGTWKTLNPPAEHSLNMAAGSAAFIYGSHHVAWASTPAALTIKLRIQTQLISVSGWPWTTLYESPVGAGSVQSIIGAVKVPAAGTLRVRLQFFAEMVGYTYPSEWGFSSLSVFAVNK